MIICHCKAVSDRTIRKVIQHGADTPRAIARACGAGRNCGGCRPAVRDILEGERSCAQAATEEAVSVEASLAAAG